MWEYMHDVVVFGSVVIPLVVAGFIMRSRTSDLPRTHLAIGRPVNQHGLDVPPPERWPVPLTQWNVPDHPPRHHHEIPVTRSPTPPPPPPYALHTLDVPFLDNAFVNVVPPGYRHAGGTSVDVVPPTGNLQVPRPPPRLNPHQDGQGL